MRLDPLLTFLVHNHPGVQAILEFLRKIITIDSPSKTKKKIWKRERMSVSVKSTRMYFCSFICYWNWWHEAGCGKDYQAFVGGFVDEVKMVPCCIDIFRGSFNTVDCNRIYVRRRTVISARFNIFYKEHLQFVRVVVATRL